MLGRLLLRREQRLHLDDLLRLQPIPFDHAIARGIGLGKKKIRVEIEERHGGIDAVDHIQEHDVLRSETAGEHDLRRVSLNRSSQHLLRLLRLERLSPKPSILLMRHLPLRSSYLHSHFKRREG